MGNACCRYRWSAQSSRFQRGLIHWPKRCTHFDGDICNNSAEVIFRAYIPVIIQMPSTHWGWHKLIDVFQTIFSTAFSWKKIYVFGLRFHWILLLRSQLTISQHWLDNGLAPKKRPAIIWTNGGIVYWRIFALLGLKELTHHFAHVHAMFDDDFFNPSPPSATYMRQWTGSALVQIMLCRLLGASYHVNQCCVVVNWTLMNKLQWF